MNTYLEIFGYCGTALVIISMMMTSVVKLRIINICGSLISMIYSICSNTWPIVILNFSLIIINIIQLIRSYSYKANFGTLKANISDSSLNYFFSVYKKDIEIYFPNFDLNKCKNEEIHLIYIDSEIVGVLIGTRNEDVINIKLDYAIPKYRDTSVAKFLLPTLKEQGISKLITYTEVNSHIKYLKKMGFENINEHFVKIL